MPFLPGGALMLGFKQYSHTKEVILWKHHKFYDLPPGNSQFYWKQTSNSSQGGSF